MPPFVRTLAKLLIGFPGFLIWGYACLAAASASSAVMLAEFRLQVVELVVFFPLCFLVAQTGHAMRVMTGILTGAPALRFASEHLAARFAWDALVQLAGILTVGAGFAVAGSLFGNRSSGLVWTVPLLVGFFLALRYLWRRRYDLHTRWWKEVAARETERATIEFHARRAAEKQTSTQP